MSWLLACWPCLCYTTGWTTAPCTSCLHNRCLSSAASLHAVTASSCQKCCFANLSCAFSTLFAALLGLPACTSPCRVHGHRCRDLGTPSSEKQSNVCSMFHTNTCSSQLHCSAPACSTTCSRLSTTHGQAQACCFMCCVLCSQHATVLA